MFKRTYWRWYTREELPYIEMVVISVDCTFKKVDDADYVAIHVYGVSGARFYLLARRHEQMGFRATKDAIRILWDEFKPSATLIEDKANGSAVIEELSREVPGVLAINPALTPEDLRRFIAEADRGKGSAEYIYIAHTDSKKITEMAPILNRAPRSTIKWNPENLGGIDRLVRYTGVTTRPATSVRGKSRPV